MEGASYYPAIAYTPILSGNMADLEEVKVDGRDSSFVAVPIVKKAEVKNQCSLLPQLHENPRKGDGTLGSTLTVSVEAVLPMFRLSTR